MAMFEMSPEQVSQWREKIQDLVASHVHGEAVLAAAPFRRGGATASMVASKVPVGGVIYAGIRLARKKKAGGLPERVMLVLTPTNLYALNFGFKGRDYKIKEEVAVWGRDGLRVSTQRNTGMTALTIESPAEDEKATLVGIGVKDDPLSQELIEALQGAKPASA